jgi:hypothetical protein
MKFPSEARPPPSASSREMVIATTMKTQMNAIRAFHVCVRTAASATTIGNASDIENFTGICHGLTTANGAMTIDASAFDP